MWKWLFDLFFERTMLDSVIVTIRSPLCNCDSKKINTSFSISKDGKLTMYLKCTICETSLAIPHDQVWDVFKVESQLPYPDQINGKKYSIDKE